MKWLYVLACVALLAAKKPANFALESPYANGIGQYKGVIHSHTRNSYDGDESPASRVQFYKDAGYTFVALTEHSTSDDPEFAPHPISGNPSIQGVVYFYGSEMSASDGDRHLHIGAINIPALWDLSYFDQSLYNAQQMIDNVEEVGGLTVINHPNIHDVSFGDIINDLTGYDAIEIWNSLLVGRGYGSQARAEDRWDYALSNGVRVWGVTGDDCHNTQNDYWGGVNCATSYLRVNSKSFSRSGIIAGLRAGNFYSGYTPQGFQDILLNVVVSPNNITATADRPVTFAFIGRNGQVFKTASGVKAATYTPNGNEGYIRIRAGAGSLTKAWSNPIFVLK